MNKRRKLLSLIICAGIVVSAFPSSGTGATNDSIAFYNSKKSILEMKEYDEAYDTNHDGIVNVFDVIRENKEVFQEESYTDLKFQIHSLETQIELLTQKLAEKEDKSQSESNLSKINSSLSSKVEKQDGKQLSSNDFTDEEKQKLEYLNIYNDTSIKSDISEISSALSGKVDNQEGKQLSSNDYTDEDKEKLNNLNNYDDASLRLEISESLSGKVDNQDGKQLSSNDYTDADKSKLESLDNYDDTQIKSELSDLNSALSGKVDKEEGKRLSSNDYTDEEKQKLESLNNYNDENISKNVNDIKIELNSISSESKGIVDELHGFLINGSISSQSSVMFDIDIKAGETYLIKLNNSENIYKISIYGQVNWNTVQEIGSFQSDINIKDIVFTAEVDMQQLNLYTTLIEEKNTDVNVSVYKKGTVSYENNEKPVINELLVIGDSYSYSGTYVNPLRDEFIIKKITNLAVVNATLKDKYVDRNEYPYSNNPVQTDNEGNHNTFACQIEKLKLNNDYLNHNPDVIFIQGGHNDSPDITTTNYVNQLIEYKENVYFGNEIKSGYIPKSIEDTDRTTFVGSLYYMITTLKKWYPSSEIYVITPTGLSYENGGNYLTYIDKSNQIIQACQWLSCPYIDWSVYGNCNFTHVNVSGDGTQENPYILTTGNEMSDFLHPDEYGGELLASPIIKALLK